MKKRIICYSTRHLPAKKQSSIARALYGYQDRSKNGRYVYQRRGILSKMLHKRIKHGCFQIANKDLSKIEKFFRERNVIIEIY